LRALGWLLWALASSTWASAWADGPERYDARVVRVFDGDTVWVQPAAGGRWRKLRLDGIDAPEICQAGGLVARDALAARVLGQQVQVTERASDDYGRGIVRLESRGEDLNRWLVQAGHAWAHRWRGSGPYVDEEEAARRERRGLFAQEAPVVPRDFRRLHGPCANPPRALSAAR
jgi:endonuclease YncB( thermonuclease family)